jgi:O-acetyl-ADP-ribose deacetylase (regulator of RNase III)
VNCLAKPGSGIAYAFAQRFPVVEEHWAEFANTVIARPGRTYVFQLPKNSNWQYVLNAATMQFPGSIADPLTIMECVSSVITECNKFGITSIAMPYLGCGVGRLAEEDFERIIKCAKSSKSLTVLLVKYKNS